MAIVSFAASPPPLNSPRSPLSPSPLSPTCPPQAEALLEAVGDFRSAYLAAVLARLSEAAGAAFPGGTRALPTAADLQKSIACVHEELKSAAGGFGGWVGPPGSMRCFVRYAHLTSFA